MTLSYLHRTVCLVCVVATVSGCATSAGKTELIAGNIPPAISAKVQEIGAKVAPPPTEALYAPLAQKEPYSGVRVVRDQRYGPDARHRLDVFTSEQAQTNRALLVYVHGGAFTRGDKRSGTSPFYDNIALWAVKQGMVGVNITYRLAPANQWPAVQQDIASVVHWLKQNAASFGGNPEKIILFGHSAGAAHVAQYIGHSALHARINGGVAGAVFLSGIFDTNTAEINPPLQSYFGTDTSQYAKRSALPGLVASPTPMLVAWAELDPPDFHKQSEQAIAALCNAGRCPTSAKLMGHSHMSEIYAINSSDESFTKLLRDFANKR
jgi:acetyl esterase/lipase